MKLFFEELKIFQAENFHGFLIFIIQKRFNIFMCIFGARWIELDFIGP